jgi:hypothetical protein
LLRFVGQVPTLTRTEGSIDGGGEIADFIESDLVTFYDLFGYVESDLEVRYQIITAVEPTVGTLRLVGQAPSLGVGFFRSPQVGTLRFVGQVPTAVLSAAVAVSPDTGSLRFEGQAPYLGDRAVYPTTGTVQFVGNIPYLQPVLLWPGAGSLRVSGQQPIINRIVAPISGTVRFKGFGTVESDLVVTYSTFDTYVTSDLVAFWQRAGDVSSDMTCTYQVFGRVGQVRVSAEMKRINVDPPTLPVIRAVGSIKRIYAKRAA